MIVVNHFTTHENGDETWTVIDLDTTTETSNFQVFNPLTGRYTACSDLLTAKNTVADINEAQELIKRQLADAEQQMLKDNERTIPRPV
jgi:hypothetical protein